MAESTQSTHPTTASTNGSTHTVQHRTVTIDGLEIFYREAGPAGAPLLALLHGFPAASHQYMTLIDRLSDQFHLLAPDYPGFGYSSAPASSNAGGTFRDASAGLSGRS